MAYERITNPPKELYHYTQKANVSQILQDGKIRKFKDSECWFCASIEDTIRLMELTVMVEGGLYIGTNGFAAEYPKFNADDYVILKLTPRYQNGDWVKWNQELPVGSSTELQEFAKEFSNLKLGFRGDLKFKENPEILDLTEVLQMREQNSPSMQDFSY